MGEEQKQTPETTSTLRILAVIACLICVAISGGASIHFAINEAMFPVGTVIQFLGSLACTWAVLAYKVPDAQAGKIAQELEILSKLHSEGLINKCDYARKKREIIDEV